MLSTKLIPFRYPIVNYIQVITRSRWQSRNPSEPHYNRKRMIEVCKPIFVPDPTPEWETCTKNKVEVPPPHPYEVLLANELNKNWEASRMILFYNVTSMPEPDQRQIRNTFHKKDLYFHHYSQKVVELALHNTPFSSVLHLFQSETALLFSEAISIDKVLKLSRKFSQVALMAGIIDNVFYSRSQIQALNEVLKRDSLQELAQFLDLLPSKLCGTVDHHTRMLCHYLGEVSNKQS